jgi:hypothetical protein
MQEQVVAAAERASESGQSSPLVGIAIAVPISVALWAMILVTVRLAFF